VWLDHDSEQVSTKPKRPPCSNGFTQPPTEARERATLSGVCADLESHQMGTEFSILELAEWAKDWRGRKRGGGDPVERGRPIQKSVVGLR
jgi:hypothetical protein